MKREPSGALRSTHNYHSGGMKRLRKTRDDYLRDKQEKRPIWGHGGRGNRWLSVGRVFHMGR